jgi:Domain of unknown function (DUF5916)
MRVFITILFLSLFNISLIGQEAEKSFIAEKINETIIIDGELTESVWQNAPQIHSFSQYTPDNGESASSKTQAWFYYNNKGVYVGIKCYEENPDDIFRELKSRDDGFGSNSDGIGVMLSPYNDGLNYNYFLVSASNVQTDIIYSGEENDESWNAVWYSEVTQSKEGLNYEVFIPYSALRFSKNDVQTWGINIWRCISKNQEWSSWNYVNNENNFWWKYTGEVSNLKDLNPPIRLSVTPYVSGYMEKETSLKEVYNYNIGMDLKYGISQSITLDMTLIPDFRQVQSDDIELNLSAYEQYYNEKRQFFTEGMDLFKKGDIFYSRRIGSRPQKYSAVEEALLDEEKVLSNPNETQLINSTKISGRTKNGFGFGLLNSMTKESFAEIEDTILNQTRDIQTQPFTNYNVLVIDQSLFDNSYVSLINTNYYNSEYLSNVVGSEFNFANSKNTYGVNGKAAYSYVEDESKSEGFKALINGGKTGGKLRTTYNLSIISDNYNQNHMGYLAHNNKFNSELNITYKTLKPFSYFLETSNELRITNNRLYNPNKYSEFFMSYVIRAKFKNHYYFVMHALWAPVDKHDYYETRTDGEYVNTGKYYHNCFTFETNPTKILSASFHYGFNESYNYFLNTKLYRFRVEPSLKLSDKTRINYSAYYQTDINTPGFVSSDYTDIYFGKRDRETVTNSIDFSYVFTNTMSVKLRFRHYWSQVKYDEYYTLEENGELNLSSYSQSHDLNYNAFNIDMTYSWNFAPGSELLVNWKYSTYSYEDEFIGDYWKNLKSISDYDNINSFSIKFLYYLDYYTFRSRFK